LNIVSKIFRDYTPGSFGLSGEAYLWEDFKSYFMEQPAIETEEEFARELSRAFESLTGASIESRSFVFVKRYNRGGVSSGLVDPWNWSAVILPRMMDRYLNAAALS